MIQRRSFLTACAGGALSGMAALGSHAAEPQRKAVRVAAIQASSHLGDMRGNRDKFSHLVEQAAKQGAKIVVLPETALTGYLSQDLRTNWHLPDWPLDRDFTGQDPLPFAETTPGPSTGHFAKLAKRLGVYITVPFLEQATKPGESTPQLFNTVCLVSPQGELVAHYRKLTPWPRPEKSWATPGDRGVQTYDTEFGRVGLAICFDIHTILEKYEPHRLWALLYPIAWVDNEHPAEWFWHRLPKRIAKFGHYVVGANWSVDAAPDNGWRGYGFSTIFDGHGQVMATAKSLYGSEIVLADLPTS